jgi:hypothetical protein
MNNINSEIKWFFENLNNKIPFAFSRFNDGEMGGIMYDNFLASRGDQLVNKTLKDSLYKAIIHKQKNYYIGIPCNICYPDMHNLALRLVGKEYEYLTRATIIINRNWKNFIENIGDILSHHSVLWIGGDDQNINNLPFKCIDQIKIPKKNSWDYYPQLKEYYKKIPKNYLILISLGPTSRILTQEWFKHRPDLTILDIGSCFDPFTKNIYYSYQKGWKETGFNLTKKCIVCN